MSPNRAKGLGTGFAALLNSALASNALLGETNDFEYIPIEKIEPRRGQPRTVFDETQLEELAASIREHGVLSPLTVRPLGEGFFQIIAGERRWRAARMAGLAELPARVVAADELKVMELSLVENLQRADLNPIEEAFGYKALGDEFGLTQEEIARRMGKSRPAIANALRLLALPQELLELIRTGSLAAGSARALAAIPNGEAMIRAARDVVENGLSTRDAEKLARALIETPESSDIYTSAVYTSTDISDADASGVTAASAGDDVRQAVEKINYMAEYERELSQTLGRRVKIVGKSRVGGANKNSGRVELEYYGDEDLEALIGQLSSFKGAAI
ncbi:MAG: ParB/RepB/Spo0J family partition protein [Oscillospiraceae bacterium]|jgi:ParB family chromosome partitioning protein|nr:ParB/RepB/Spo0J family partition protein [Oscillospiraceae bacterium]